MFVFFKTIRFRLTLWFVTALALMLVIIGVLVYFGLQRTLDENVNATLRDAALRSVQPKESAGPIQTQQDVLEQLALLSLAPARLLSIDGAALQDDPLFPRIPIAPEALADAKQGRQRYETLLADGVSYRLYTAPVVVNGERSAVVQVVQSLSREQNTLAQLRTLLLVLFPVALILAALGGSFLAGQALAPVEQVRRNVEGLLRSRMDQSDLKRRVSGNLSQDEIGRLARTFDDLLSGVNEAMRNERQFTADASHELRSPLTVLKGELSVALSRARTAEEYQEVLMQLEASVDEMGMLVEDLLTIARSSSAQAGALLTEQVNVCELVEQVCERLRIIAEEKHITLTLQKPNSPLDVQANRLKLQRVFTNLLDNALRYTPEEGRIQVRVWRDFSTVRIEVEDTGIGIAAEHLPRIFDRFYRTDAARARESGGTGLGLAIAQAIIRSHGGEIMVTSTVGKGSCFKVTLPLIASTSAARANPFARAG